MTTRRQAIRSLFAAAAAAVAGPMALRAVEATGAAKTKMTVYKSPTCGCCKAWVEHARGAGFDVTAIDVQDVAPTKRKLGVPADLGSCHTGLVEGYAIEGHVPADLIQKLLREKPAGIRGLAVPGMPAGSPGMEVPGMKDAYDVIAFTAKGGRRVYAKR